jgi:ferredoxin-NADP reductase/ferredoxin
MNATQAEDASTINLAQLLLRIFIYVTDTEKEITPYEIRRFNRLLEDIQWTGNMELRRALERLRLDYAALWKAYTSKSFTVDLQAITEQLESTWFAQTANVAALRASLRDFVQKIGQVGSPALARLGAAGTAMSKATARATIEGLLMPPTDAVESTPPADASVPRRPDPAMWPAARLRFDGQSTWQGGRVRVRCVNITDETTDVKTFSFAAVPERLFQYKPGQFITLELPIDGKAVRRCYTLSSSPSRPYLLSITVKRVTGGLVSNWLHDNMVDDCEIDVLGPSGEFTCLDHPSERLLLISGGSGVTPMMSMLRWMCDTQSPVDVVFLNNVRTPGDVIFERELKLISARLRKRLRLGVVPGVLASGQAWNGLTGPLSDHMLQTFAPDFLQREVFVCGPAGYMDMVRNMLEQLRFPMQHYHQESFGGAAAAPAAAPPAAPAIARPPAAPAGTAATTWALAAPVAVIARLGAPASVTASAPRPVAAPTPMPTPPAARSQPRPPVPAAPAAAKGKPTISLSKSGKLFSCSSDEMILDAAERHGVPLPSSCRAGICGTCKVRTSSGVVVMDDQQALSEGDIADGFVLVCIGRPTGNVVLEC